MEPKIPAAFIKDAAGNMAAPSPTIRLPFF